jgi:hypothetical protein
MLPIKESIRVSDLTDVSGVTALLITCFTVLNVWRLLAGLWTRVFLTMVEPVNIDFSKGGDNHGR